MDKIGLAPQLVEWKLKLKKLIKDLGLTQQGFANQIGVRRRAVCRWVSLEDSSIPHRRHLKLIRQLMNVNDLAEVSRIRAKVAESAIMNDAQDGPYPYRSATALGEE